LKAVKEATNTGIREAGIDVRLCDIGAAIQEVMESYEIELDGKVGGSVFLCLSALQLTEGMCICRRTRSSRSAISMATRLASTKSTPERQSRSSRVATRHVWRRAIFSPSRFTPLSLKILCLQNGFGLQTFGSTGRGLVVEDMETSHYMKSFDADRVTLRTKGAHALLATINKNFGTLAFCRRWLDRLGEDKYLMSLRQLCEAGIVVCCAILC
jgi:methionyl aminopeptidase